MDDITQNNGQVSGEETTELNDVEKLQKERDEYLEGWKRAKADLINYKKEEVQRFESILKMANEQMIRDLLNVLDSFDLALASLKGDAQVEKGVYMIRAQFEDALKKYGLEKIQVNIGDQFDPAIHDAIAVTEDVSMPSGTIADEVEKGYRLNGKLIRAARVRVVK